MSNEYSHNPFFVRSSSTREKWYRTTVTCAIITSYNGFSMFLQINVSTNIALVPKIELQNNLAQTKYKIYFGLRLCQDVNRTTGQLFFYYSERTLTEIERKIISNSMRILRNTLFSLESEWWLKTVGSFWHVSQDQDRLVSLVCNVKPTRCTHFVPVNCYWYI